MEEVKMLERENYFKELREQIMDESKWDKNRFHVFDYEAGTGKSQNTLKYIAQLCNKKPYRVLYVQRFVRDNELKNTVATINKHAGKQIAMGFDGGDSKYENRKKKAMQAQVLCISHKMYSQICKDINTYLKKNRDMLIIDEYPDLLEKVSIKEGDIGLLWEISSDYQYDLVEELAIAFRKRKINLINQFDDPNKIYYIDFSSEEYEKFRNGLNSFIGNVTDKKHKELFEKFIQVLSNGCYFYDKSFHTFDNNIEFKLLDNNIILDANASFDHRYQLSDIFLIRTQEKYFSYSSSKFNYFRVNTGKRGLTKQVNLPEIIFDTTDIKRTEKTLFVTDKANRKIVENKLGLYFENLGYSKEEIERLLTEKLRIDYFGNLIGVNTYRDFKNVIIMKTPNYDYLTYILYYFYFSSMKNRTVEDIEVFEHEQIEKIRKTSVTGEIYQAIKRVNRDNSQESEIFVFSSNEDAVDDVINQLPEINVKKDTLSAVKKSVKNGKTMFEKRVEKTKDILLEAKEKGFEYIRKKEVREQLGVSDSSNFNKIIKACNSILQKNGIVVDKGQKIYLNK